MHEDSLRFWPFDVLPESSLSETQRVLTAFFDETLAGGHTPYVDSTWSLIGFGHLDRRHAQFTNRGRNRYWEPWLGDFGTPVRLGPLFGHNGSRCVVLDGYADLTTFTRRWLRGDTLDDCLAGVAVYDRHDPRIAMTRSA